MSTTINWTTATDSEKNACFAEHVAGFSWYKLPHGSLRILCDARRDDHSGLVPARDDAQIASDFARNLPDYLHSADAVLPWLEKQSAFTVDFRFTGGAVVNIWKSIHGWPGVTGEGYAKHLPEAAMIALLRANGVEVIT